MGEVVYRQGQGLVELEAPPIPPVPLLIKRDWGLFDYQNNRFRLVVDAGVDAAKLPAEFWVPVASQLKPFDRVDVLTRDGARFVEILVVQANARGVDAIALRAIDIPKFAERVEGDLPEGYTIAQDAVRGMWQVHGPDGEKFGGEHSRKELARQYLIGHAAITQPARTAKP